VHPFSAGDDIDNETRAVTAWPLRV